MRPKGKGTSTSTEYHASELMANKGSKNKKNNKKQFSGSNLHKDVCAWCKEKGHWKRDCPKRGQQGQNRSAAMVEKGSSSEDDYVLSMDDVTHQSDMWVLDSGASYHICSNRKLFSSYCQTYGGSVHMANGAVCKVIGIGSLRSKNHDGKTCTLNEFRHVPRITMNLISLSLLDKKGFSFKGEGGDLCVYKGSKVLLKGIKDKTLYVLQGSAITGLVGIVSAKIQEADQTRLWHMRLGHMSERGMQELHKKDYLVGHMPKSLGFCLARRFWGEAVSMACYLVNRSPHTGIGCKIPIEIWSQKTTDYSNLKVFGCVAYYHVDDCKLEPRAKKGVFMGYETEVGAEKSKVDASSELSDPKDSKVLGSSQPKTKEQELKDSKEYIPPKELVHESFTARRTRRDKKLPTRLEKDYLVRYALQVAEEVKDESSTYRAAITAPSQHNGLPIWKKRWNFLAKTQHGILVLLAMVAHQDLELEQLDVKTAFLHGELEKEIYMNQPKGFQVSRKEDYVCKLKRSLYGLKQSSMQWYKRFDSFMLKIGYWKYSDYACDIDSRRLMTRYVFTLGDSVVSWKVTLQPTVTLSTTDSEYMALTQAAMERIWLKHMVNDLGLHQDQAIVHCDSLSAICLTKDQVHHERTKHIDVRYHFLRSESRIKVKNS
ncbi:hypothetical protein AXG93_412s1350 [Marchantia polymorpha subsp. ruderalis]|uniref:CCHC-type domain-containing protein n=1 Tax=Marchantia polymorpha subsp. ruderalis TaxID=1480154 RepID=A0A176VQK2_MARPO|nr:hypothetical protein AXG93_412s1350 [Marchantia polymorpha subsp. ruderalis]